MTREMRCEEAIEKLLDYLDRELDARAEKELAHHLEHCRACFSRAEFERRLRERVKEAAAAKAPDTLRHRIRAMIERY